MPVSEDLFDEYNGMPISEDLLDEYNGMPISKDLLDEYHGMLEQKICWMSRIECKSRRSVG